MQPKMQSLMIVALILLLLPSCILAQGTLEDYQRADSLRTRMTDLYYHATENVTWIGKTHQLWYRTRTAEGKRFMLVDADAKTTQPAFDHARLAQGLSEASKETYKPSALPFNRIEFKKEGKAISFILDDFEWTCGLKNYTCKKGNKVDRSQRWRHRRAEGRSNPALSPDSTWEAFIRNYNVHIRSREDGNEIQLSQDGIEGHAYDDAFRWSPDSKKLVADRVLPGHERLVHYVESSPDDQLQPKYSTREYHKPGDVITISKPHLFSIDKKQQVPLVDTLYKSPYHIRNISWREDSRAFTFEYNQRGHQVYRIIEVNGESGFVRPLINEASETFFCYYSKLYRNHVDDGRQIIWMSERDGWNHLYLYDGMTGEIRNQITRGQWVVRRVLHVDEEKRQIFFLGSGREKGLDPYFYNLYRINFNGRGLKRLTEGDANHNITFSQDHRYFIDQANRVDMAGTTSLRAAENGRLLMEIEKADIDGLLQAGWKAPEVFHARGRDGKTDIWGIIWRPSNFDPQNKYRVIEYIYAGPHNSFVPKSFRPHFSQQSLAELGFIVVQIDGMGTSNRSKTFHDVCWKDLKDAGFPDRILWHKAVAKKYEFYDITDGIGIYGHSAGGQNSTGALLFHPDFYKVAVSSCGCHDNRMDKISWNEQWMGYPLGPHYAESSNVDNAHRLEGKLFLLVGELDTNVPPASTLQVVDALIQANKDFDLLVLPGVGHAIGGDYGERRRRDYFVQHLLGVEPPDWNRQ